MEENGLVVLTEEYLMSKIYIVRGGTGDAGC